MNKFSLFNKPIKYNKYPCRDITINEFIELLKSEQYKPATDKCKKLKQELDDKELRKHKAEALDYVTFGGTFSERKNDALIQQSGLFAADVDDIKNYSEIREALKKDPYTLLLFESPSGGLKVVIKIPLNVGDFHKYVETYYDYLNNHFNVEGKVDSKCKDISRACFCSYDLNYFYNENAKIWDKKYQKEIEPEQKEFYKIYTESQLRAMLKYIPLRNEGKGLGNHTFTVMMGLIHYSKYRKKDYFPVFRWWCDQFNSGSTVEQMRGKWSEWFDKPETDKPVTIKSIVYEAYQHGYKEVEKKRELHKINNINDNFEEGMDKVALTLLAQNKKSEACEHLKKEIIAKFHVKTHGDDKAPEIRVYDEGIFKPNGGTIIEKELAKRLGSAYTPTIMREVIVKIKAVTYIDSEIFFKEPSPNLICLKDGVFDLKKKELVPHSPSFNFHQKIPIKYNSEAKRPDKIIQFLNAILPSKADVNLVLKLFGYSLYRGFPIHIIVLFIGEGRNGKGALLRLLKTFLGDKNCSAIALQQLADDQYAASDLHGKLANLAGDIGNGAINDIGKAKAISGGDSITSNRKYYAHLTFTPYAKQFYSCNELPYVKDDSFGFYDRIILLNFPYTFVRPTEYDKNNPCHRVQDPNIEEGLKDHTEMEGLLLMALDALGKLLEKGYFEDTPGAEEIRKEWRRKSSSFAAFWDEHVKQSNKGISKRDFRKYYETFCAIHKLRPISETAMGKVMKKSYFIHDYQDRDSLRYWEGLEIAESHSLQGSQGFSKSPHERVSSIVLENYVNPVDPVGKSNTEMLNYLDKFDRPEGINLETLALALNRDQEELHLELLKLSERGDVVQTKPDHWRILK